MTIKIPKTPPTRTVERTDEPQAPAVEGTSEAGASARVERAEDPVAVAAEKLASGEITRDEAVSSILETVLDSAAVKQAPAELREEISEALSALIESDPYLSSLIHSLDA